MSACDVAVLMFAASGQRAGYGGKKSFSLPLCTMFSDDLLQAQNNNARSLLTYSARLAAFDVVRVCVRPGP